jgi:hypothetical protein
MDGLVREWPAGNEYAVLFVFCDEPDAALMSALVTLFGNVKCA